MLIAVILSIETLQLPWHMSHKFNLYSFWWINVGKKQGSRQFQLQLRKNSISEFTSAFLFRGRTPSFLLTQSPHAFLLILDWATWLRSLRGDKLDTLRKKQNQKIHSRGYAKGCSAAGTRLQLDYCKTLEWMQPVYLVLCNDYFTLHIHSCWASVIVNTDKAVPHQAAGNVEATQNMR